MQRNNRKRKEEVTQQQPQRIKFDFNDNSIDFSVVNKPSVMVPPPLPPRSPHRTYMFSDKIPIQTPRTRANQKSNAHSLSPRPRAPLSYAPNNDNNNTKTKTNNNNKTFFSFRRSAKKKKKSKNKKSKSKKKSRRQYRKQTYDSTTVQKQFFRFAPSSVPPTSPTHNKRKRNKMKKPVSPVPTHSNQYFESVQQQTTNKQQQMYEIHYKQAPKPPQTYNAPKFPNKPPKPRRTHSNNNQSNQLHPHKRPKLTHRHSNPTHSSSTVKKRDSDVPSLKAMNRFKNYRNNVNVQKQKRNSDSRKAPKDSHSPDSSVNMSMNVDQITQTITTERRRIAVKKRHHKSRSRSRSKRSKQRSRSMSPRASKKMGKRLSQIQREKLYPLPLVNNQNLQKSEVPTKKLKTRHFDFQTHTKHRSKSTHSRHHSKRNSKMNNKNRNGITHETKFSSTALFKEFDNFYILSSDDDSDCGTTIVNDDEYVFGGGGGGGDCRYFDKEAAEETDFQRCSFVLFDVLKSPFRAEVLHCIHTIRIDVLCLFLPIIAFTFSHEMYKPWMKQINHALVDRIIEHSVMKQSVVFLLNCYAGVDSISDLFEGTVCGVQNSNIKHKTLWSVSNPIDFWHQVINKKHSKKLGVGKVIDLSRIKHDRFLLRDPMKQSSGKINQIVVRKVLNSKCRPLLLDVYCSNDNVLSSTIILKYGDDLRKDAAMMMVFRWINYLWAKCNVSCNLVTYKIVAIDAKLGCIELIKNCISLKNCKDLDIGNGNEHLIGNLIRTSVASYIASFLLGIGDRHWDNILIRKTDLSLFHVDFNYVFDDRALVDTNDFAITKDLYNLLGARMYNDVFIDLAVKAYQVLRAYHRQFINFTCLAFSYLSPHKNIEKCLMKKLRMNQSDSNAKKWLTAQLKNAPFRMKTKFKNKMHKLATDFS